MQTSDRVPALGRFVRSCWRHRINGARVISETLRILPTSNILETCTDSSVRDHQPRRGTGFPVGYYEPASRYPRPVYVLSARNSSMHRVNTFTGCLSNELEAPTKMTWYAVTRLGDAFSFKNRRKTHAGEKVGGSKNISLLVTTFRVCVFLPRSRKIRVDY